MKAKTTSEIFEEFNSTEWIHWIYNTYQNKKVDPYLNLPDLEFDALLVVVKNILDDHKISTYNLGRACVSIINENSKTESHNDLLFFLIQFLGHLKPESFASILENIFIAENLVNRKHKNFDLQLVLLTALINFTNISDLSTFFQNKILTCENPEYLLVGLRYFNNRHGSIRYYKYAEDLINKIVSGNISSELITGIVTSFNEVTYRNSRYDTLFLFWYEINNKLKFEASEIHKIFSEVFLLWLNKNNKLLNYFEYLRLLRVFVLGNYTPEKDYFSETLNTFFTKTDFTESLYRNYIRALSPYVKNGWINYFSNSEIMNTEFSKSHPLIGERSALDLVIQSVANLEGLEGTSSKQIFKEHINDLTTAVNL